MESHGKKIEKRKDFYELYLHVHVKNAKCDKLNTF